MKKVCPNCGAETEGKFCPDCGTNLEALDNTEAPEIKPSDKEDENQTSSEASTSEKTVAAVNVTDNGEGVGISNDESSLNGNEVIKTENQTVVNQPDNSDDSKIVEFNESSETAGSQAPKDKAKSGKKKTGLIIGGAVAALLLLAIIVISSQPKLVSIDAKYNGPTEKGTVVDNSSNITVTGTYDDKSTKDVTGWSVSETTIVPGFNDIDVSYQDKTASISVYSPLMSGGKYLASVDEIKDVLYAYNTKHVDGFSGFSKDSEIAGKYNYNGTPLDLSVSFTKQSGGENIDVDGDEIPNAVIITMILRQDDFGSQLDRIISAGAAAFTAVDPDISYDDAYSQIKECTTDTVRKGEGAIGTDEKKLDNVNIGTGMLLANGNLLVFYSFKSF